MVEAFVGARHIWFGVYRNFIVRSQAFELVKAHLLLPILAQRYRCLKSWKGLW